MRKSLFTIGSIVLFSSAIANDTLETPENIDTVLEEGQQKHGIFEILGIDPSTLVVTMIAMLFISIIIFLLIREFNTWYWKINESIKNQNTMNSLLEKQNELLQENNEILHRFVDDFTNK